MLKIQILCDDVDHTCFHIVEMGCQWLNFYPPTLLDQNCSSIDPSHTFQPTNVFVITFTEIELSQTSNSIRSTTQEAVNMAAPAGSSCGVDMSVNSNSWEIRNEQKLA